MAAIPQTLCLLRTSALGDATHVVPLVRTLQSAWPATQLTWLIGKLERKLVGDIPGVEFVTFDKSAGLAAYGGVRRALGARRFDALLHMQVALRANLLSLCVHADRRIGYDHARSKDLHGMFVREHIPARTGEHVLDAIGSFVEPLGLKQSTVRWNIPIRKKRVHGRLRNGPMMASPCCWFRPVPATRCATGAPSATPRSPTTRPRRCTCGWC
jgi:heptosyltransferase I